ncbi:MAG: ABC transporter permease [Planctomycetaceae bacterium]|jgi:ABC-2 type transport system permease protein|nr:ABC transporter permease [Planctomycetaceae bacterium]
MKLRPQVVTAIFRRNFSAYFSGMLGYLFILVFVMAGGYFAFSDSFFTANEPNLDQLTQWYPVLLLFFVPAITMSVWAEERKAGTDELLFTMPATDVEILLAKYLSVVAVYTVALVFSMAHVFVLGYLGNPDWGLLTATYFGYWIAGAALLSAGMLASQMTNNMTVAFVLGVVLCMIPVAIGYVGGLPIVGNVLEPFSIREQFRDLGTGVVPMTGILYFIGFIVVMLYLNLVLMSRRHWKHAQRTSVAFEYGLRAVCIGIVATCVTAWAGYSPSMRIDATSENLFSLAPSTKKILSELDSDRPIEIQAFLSPDVPPEYEETRKRLVGLLRQFDDLGGKNLEVRFVDVEPFSPQADEAEKFGIAPVRVLTEDGGRRDEVDLFLGAVAISSYDKVVVPFFGKGLPVEYELTRSVQTVANDTRYTVGILRTDAGLLDGSREWRIVTELRKQYEVVEISPATAIDANQFDVLLAAMPSSLTDPEMANLVAYARTGNPLLIFDDPFPLSFNSGGFGVAGAPRQPKPSAGGGMMGGGQPPVPKADGGRATRLMNVLGVQWQYDRIAFDLSNPHPEFAMLPAEYVFVARGSSNDEAFNDESLITKGLQEVIVLYGGTIEKAASSENAFTPLVQTGFESGLLRWEEFVDEGGLNFMSMQQTANPRRNPARRVDSDAFTLAARVQGNGDDGVNAIFVADIDMISDFFFDERTFGNLDITFDNVTFVLNAVDALVGDESFINLRSRRAKHRSLNRVEEQRNEFLEKANEAERKADDEAKEELEARKKQLSERVKEIEENEDLDPIAKQQMRQQAQQTEQQRLSLAEARIDQKKNDDIRRIRAQTQKDIDALERKIQWRAIGLPALPALLVGIIVFAGRWRDEKLSVTKSRRRDH